METILYLIRFSLSMCVSWLKAGQAYRQNPCSETANAPAVGDLTTSPQMMDSLLDKETGILNEKEVHVRHAGLVFHQTHTNIHASDCCASQS